MASHLQLKVGIAQIDSKLGDLSHNFQLHLEMVKQARSAGVSLLVFPELSLTGYFLDECVPQVAMARNSPMVLELAQAAGDMTVVFGFVEEGPGAQFYNVAAAVRQGRMLHLHRKLNLPTYGRLQEGKIFGHGQQVDVFEVSNPWSASLLICADLWNPALVHIAMQQHATVLLAPVNSVQGGVSDDFSSAEGWELTLRFYAMMYGVPVLMANRTGIEGTGQFWGGSCIVGARGEILAQAGGESPCLLTANLDYNAVRQARFDLPTIRDANLPLVQREITRLVDRRTAPQPL